MQAYHVQVAVDELQLSAGQAVTQDTNDTRQLLPMITTMAQQSGDTPSQRLADAGYCSEANLAAIAHTSIDAYISTRKQKHGERLGPCPRGPLPNTATVLDRMSRKLHTKAGAAAYAARKGIVEPVIGQIKQARGFRQFLLRGTRQGASRMVVGVQNPQHSQAVSPLRLRAGGRKAPTPLGHPRPPTRPSPRPTTGTARAQRKAS